jgi:hypothetical protein
MFVDALNEAYGIGGFLSLAFKTVWKTGVGAGVGHGVGACVGTGVGAIVGGSVGFSSISATTIAFARGMIDERPVTGSHVDAGYATNS